MRQSRYLAIGAILLILSGCLAIPQVGFMLGRIALSSMGVENVRIGNFNFSPGVENIDQVSLLSAGLGLAGLPVNVDLPLKMSLPDGVPSVQLEGFSWDLKVPGAEQTSGQSTQPIALNGGEETSIKLPVALIPNSVSADAPKEQKLNALIDLAKKLSGSGELPAGSQLALTPTLPPDLSRLMQAPTLTLDIGNPDDALNSVQSSQSIMSTTQAEPELESAPAANHEPADSIDTP